MPTETPTDTWEKVNVLIFECVVRADRTAEEHAKIMAKLSSVAGVETMRSTMQPVEMELPIAEGRTRGPCPRK